jgi:excisionase family DNA binding protein
MSAALTQSVVGEPERDVAREASQAVSHFAGRGAVQVEAVPVGGGTEQRQTFILPASAVKLLQDMLVHLAQGAGVQVVPDHAEFTTQQAADFLNVSRPWIVKLIERGELAHRMVGTHRRILFSELRAHKEKSNRSADAALDELVADAQAMGEYE